MVLTLEHLDTRLKEQSRDPAEGCFIRPLWDKAGLWPSPSCLSVRTAGGAVLVREKQLMGAQLPTRGSITWITSVLFRKGKGKLLITYSFSWTRDSNTFHPVEIWGGKRCTCADFGIYSRSSWGPEVTWAETSASCLSLFVSAGSCARNSESAVFSSHRMTEVTV